MEEKEIGKITHYFGKIQVGVIELSNKLKVGETIHIKGSQTDFSQVVSSMQMEHQNVKEAKKGEAVGLKTDQPAKEGDKVYRVIS